MKRRSKSIPSPFVFLAIGLFILFGIGLFPSRAGIVETELPKYNVVWDSPSNSINDSMPVGNGRIAGLVWAEPDGDLRVSLALGDSWDENARSIRLGNLRFKITPNPFVKGEPFKQVLGYMEGEIVVTAGKNPEVKLRIWVDANNPVVHVEAEADRDFSMEVSPELWRTKPEVVTQSTHLDYIHTSALDGTPGIEMKITPDTVMKDQRDRIGWYHRNETSCWPATMASQWIDSAAFGVKDPFTYRTSGAVVMGNGLVNSGDGKLVSNAARKQYRVDMVCDTKIAPNVDDWKTNINREADLLSKAPIEQSRLAHQKYWSDFWNKSYLFVTGDEDAGKVTKAWIAGRYLMAGQGRAEGPIQFNGGLYTFENDKIWWHDYTQFNQRFVYWSLLASGDFDLMMPFFDMNLNSIPVNRARARSIWNHDGFLLPEHMIPYGPQSGSHFGWKRGDHPRTWCADDCTFLLYEGTPEIACMMLDYFAYTGDAKFAARKLIPFSNGLMTWHDQHWQKAAGKLVLSPIYSGEGDRNLKNSMADIAGLTKLVNGLLALPPELITPENRSFWVKFKQELPPLPISKGRLNTAEDLFQGSETNNQNLWPIFPLRLYGYGLPDLPVAVDSFHDRRGKLSANDRNAWRHDAPHAAYLGLADEARALLVLGVTNYRYRYEGFVSGEPDGLHCIEPLAIGKTALQAMILHPGAGNTLNLLNAWPAGWNAQFKLQAPQRTTVQGNIATRQVTDLVVTPASRAADVKVRTNFN
jgi:hypothetical protein